MEKLKLISGLCNILRYSIFIGLLSYSYGIDITDLAFGGQKEYRPAAFGDFNSDKLTDMFILKNDGNDEMTLQVLISSTEQPLLHDNGPFCQFNDIKIKGVVPADFDGDGAMDVLLVTLDGQVYKAFVLWGNLTHLDCENVGDPLMKMSSQPLLLDYNGDMIADLFGADESGNRTVWIFNEHRDTPYTKSLHGTPLHKPSSHAFVDIIGDLSADIWINTETQYEVWSKPHTEYVLQLNISFPKINDSELKFLGQASFADVNLDGDLEVILPVCIDESCKQSKILVYEIENSKWYDLHINLKDNDGQNWFFPDTNIRTYLYLDIVTLRVGDYNLDGYPDVLATLVDSTGTPQVTLLENTECVDNCEFPRTFTPKWGLLDKWTKSVLGTFFDFEEDGSLDVILLHKTDDDKYSVAAFKNSMEYDAMFVKVSEFDIIFFFK